MAVLHRIIVIPALAAGEYKIEIVTQFNGGKMLKEPRNATLEKVLTVA